VSTAILTAVFVAEWATGALSPLGRLTWIDPITMLALGANSPALVEAGEWHRLVTGNFLHGGWIHFVFNVIALLYLGGHLELLLGARRFVALFLVSCLGGSVASAYLTDALSAIGVSTGLMGLIGANMVFLWRYSGNRLEVIKSQGLLLFLIVALSLPFEWLLGARVDHFGHLGGLLAGGLYVVLTMPAKSVAELENGRRDPFAGWMAALTTALFLGTAAHTAVTFASQGLAPAAESFLAHVETPKDEEEAEFLLYFFNNAAWILATDAGSTVAQLETALERMLAVGEAEPRDRVAERDTLATLYFRLGRYAPAVRLERQVLEHAQDPEVAERLQLTEDDVAFFASQLARFEWARHREGPDAEGTDAEGTDVHLVRAPRSDCSSSEEIPPGAARSPGLLLSRGEWGRPVEIHVLLVRDAEPLAIATVVAGPDAPVWLEHRLDDDLLACDVRPVVTLVDTTAATDVGAEVRWRLWRMSPEAAALPLP
jgi:membrane associated rhomboid family serine protease